MACTQATDTVFGSLMSSKERVRVRISSAQTCRSIAGMCSTIPDSIVFAGRMNGSTAEAVAVTVSKGNKSASTTTRKVVPI